MTYRHGLGEEKDVRVGYAVLITLDMRMGSETGDEMMLPHAVESCIEDIEAEMVLDAHQAIKRAVAAIEKAEAEHRETMRLIGGER